MPARRRWPVLGPAYWHPQAAGRRGNFLLNGPAMWRPPSVPVAAFGRKLSGIPLTGGQGSTVVSSAPAGGSGALVQSAWASTATANATVTVTLGTSNPSGPSPGPTTAGNCLIVYVSSGEGTTNPTVSGITLGGSAGNWASAKSQNNNADLNSEIWVDWNCAGGQTVVAVSFSGGTGAGGAEIVRVEERTGILATSNPVDQVNGANGSSAAPASGNTPTLSQANEIVVGTISGGNTVAGPASPWVNQAVISQGTESMVTGAQVVSSTAGIGYAGTQTAGVWGAVVVSLKLAPAPAGTAGLATISVGPQGLGNVWYPAQVNVSTTSGVNDTSTCQVFLGPAQQPVTLLGTIFPGGFGTLAAAVPPLAPGQYLIAQWTGGNPGDVAAINVIGTMDSVMIG